MQTRSAVVVLALAGCVGPMAPLPPLYDSGPRDASGCPDCPDTGPIVIHRDGGHDGGPIPDANVDAFMTDSGPDIDGGTTLAVTIDGTLGETAWGEPLTATIDANDPFAGDHLDTLFYFRDTEWLYLGFEGGLVGGDSVVFFVDTIALSGVTLMGTPLGDMSGAVDSVLSIPMNGTAEFMPEVGWGTSAMPNASSTGSDTIGWRQLAPAGSFPLLAGSHSACTATGCETAVPLSAIGASASSTITFVVRLGRPGADTGWSNQTFPTTDSASPEYVSAFVISVPTVP
jgi:hypothetical protein